MRRFQQQGLRCTNCGDTIYSNDRYDKTYCLCGWWWISGGFTHLDFDGPGMQMTDPEWVTRNVDRAKLPHRYRDEVPV